MEYLDDLLNKKVERERLNRGSEANLLGVASGTTTAPARADGHGATTADRPTLSAAPRLCWLCNRTSPLRFRLQGPIHLCFTCFRASYLSLLLPLINTPARRESDAEFLKLIYTMEEERAASVGSPTEDSLTSTYGEIIEPQRASFVMNSSMMRQRRVEEEQQRRLSATRRGAGGDEHAAATANAPTFWCCPRCTFLNAALARECEACDFVNPGFVTCPVCKAQCPIGMVGSPKGKVSAASRCTKGELHRIWNCRECGGLNTLDGDRCSRCHQPRYWACSQCTALHHMARGEDGLRYCPTCGAYNTPDDVLVGQAKIDKEAKFAEMVTAQRDAEKRRNSVADKERGGGSGAHLHHPPVEAVGAAVADGEIVFGVNDAQTLEERARQQQIENNERRLSSRLNRLHISRNVHKTDGNCLFSALANQLFGQPRLHYLVRSLATAYMSEHAADYSILFDGPAEWRAYLTAMKELGTWGDELCLNAAARCFRVNIHVITSDRERWHIVFQHEQLTNSRTARGEQQPPPGLSSNSRGASVANSEQPGVPFLRQKPAAAAPPKYNSVSLFLAYLAPVHYDDITPSPVAHLQLGELLSGELNHRMKRKQTSCGATDTHAKSVSVPTGVAPAPACTSPPATGRLPARSPGMDALNGTFKTRPESSESLPHMNLDYLLGGTAVPPTVPRSRPPSGKQEAVPSRPPPNPPAGFRGSPGDYSW